MRPVCNLQPLAKHTPGVWYQYPEVGKPGSYSADKKPEAQGNYAALIEIHPFVLLLYAVLCRVTASSRVLLQARGQTVCVVCRGRVSCAKPRQSKENGRDKSSPFHSSWLWNVNLQGGSCQGTDFHREYQTLGSALRAASQSPPPGKMLTTS